MAQDLLKKKRCHLHLPIALRHNQDSQIRLETEKYYFRALESIPKRG